MKQDMLPLSTRVLHVSITIRTGRGRTSKEADESPFFSPSAEIDICIPHRASACLSCLFHTVVEIVTVNVCVWNNRRYAKHHPDGLYSKHQVNMSKDEKKSLEN